MPGSEKKWDAVTERDLCIALFVASNDGRIAYNWNKTHELMQSLGYAFTKDAMSQHFTKKILRDWKNRCNGEPGGSAPATPKKAAEAPAKRKAPAAKKPAEVKQGDGADGADDVAAAPAKKVKTEKQQAPAPKARKAKKAKQASDDDGDIDEEKFQAWLNEED